MKAALYSRYSTDQQREASIEDQERVCLRLAERHGFAVIARYQDKAISGGTTHRPGYQALLAAVRRGDFEVIVAEDVSRLRNMAEQGPRLAELHDLGVAIVTHDFDSRQENAGLLGAVMGASSESYRKEIARRTRRGLEGRARAGAASGSKAYGYIPASKSPTGQIEIDAEQAEVVRWIFQKYTEGWSAMRIATDLNRRRVPSPAALSKLGNRTPGWSGSTIAGDPRRGLGILNCETYHGIKVWGKTARIRSAADSRKRKCVLKPERDWIVMPAEQLRIVPEPLWQRVKSRQRQQTLAIGERVSQGMTRSMAKSTGKRGQYVFSGLLRCEACGSRLVMANGRSYTCAGHLYGRGCKVGLSVRRSVVEDRLLSSVKANLVTPEVIAEVRRRVVRALNAPQKERSSPAPRIKALKAEITNLTDAIAAGMLRASPALGERLKRAEDELAALQVIPPPVYTIEQLPVLMARYEGLVAELQQTLNRDVFRARTALQAVLGDVIPVRVAADGTHLEALIGLRIEQEAMQGNGLSINLVPWAWAGSYRQVVALK